MDAIYEEQMLRAQHMIDRLEWKWEHGKLTEAEWYEGITEAIDIQLKAKAWQDELDQRERDYREERKQQSELRNGG